MVTIIINDVEPDYEEMVYWPHEKLIDCLLSFWCRSFCELTKYRIIRIFIIRNDNQIKELNRW